MITNGYCTLSDLKAALRITDNIDDALLELCVESASRDIDGTCERVFYSAGSAVREYVPTDALVCEIDDAYTISTIKTSSDGVTFSTTWTASDYQAEPLNGVVGGVSLPYNRLRAVGSFLFPTFDNIATDYDIASVQVTGQFGFSAVPVAIKQATILLAMRHFKRYDSPLGIAGFSDLGAVRVGRVDPDVMALISPFKKVRMA